MALLPNGYKVVNCIGGYYNSGIVSQSGLEIDALYHYVNLSEGMFFGARNTNSSTSAGQLYLSTSYFGYRNARVSVSGLAGHTGFVHLYVNDNYCEVNDYKSIVSVSGSQGTFTGTRQMYINNYNNAGSAGTSAGGSIYGFIIKKDGVKLADYVPCRRDSDSAYGLYDLVSDSFISPLASYSPTMGLVSIQNTEGGQAFLKTYHGELVSELYSASAMVTEYFPDIRAIAIPQGGYEFEGWEINGRIVSKDLVYDFGTDTNTVLIPHFVKATSLKLNQKYFARVQEYGLQDWVTFSVTSASISESGLEKTSSQLVCESIPSVVVQGCPITLYTPKGKLIWTGMVEAIEGNTITCREPLAFLDLDYLFKSGLVEANANVIYGIRYLIEHGVNRRDFVTLDSLLSERNHFIFSEQVTDRMSLYYDQISHTPFPSITETSTENFEEFIQGFSSFGVFVKPKWGGLMRLDPYYFKNNDTLSFGDNLENITNIQITEESQEGTIVQIYNSTGATLRGMYGVTKEGTVARYDSGSIPAEDFLGYSNYVGEIVMSDDPISTITADKLSSSYLNHKITFDVAFNDLLTFDMLKVGIPVEFYTGNRLFHSVITAVNYDILPNVEEIMNAQITLGNVRTSLTSKLNKRK